MQTLIHGDLIDIIPTITTPIDIVVTSPPYNRKMAYNAYKDNKKRDTYMEWTHEWIKAIKNVLSPNGSFFLNIGDCPTDPWITDDIAAIARKEFTLQNKIHWIKSITIKNKSYGHYKPINSQRYLNNLVEMIYHFTLSGGVPINRLNIGVPYSDKTNIKRWHRKNDKRCRGNAWFIPYNTKQQKEDHPAIFPDALPEYCIKLHGYNTETVVLDPFVGSGTTLLICKKLGIHGIGIDIDKSYINLSEKIVN